MTGIMAAVRQFKAQHTQVVAVHPDVRKQSSTRNTAAGQVRLNMDAPNYCSVAHKFKHIRTPDYEIWRYKWWCRGTGLKLFKFLQETKMWLFNEAFFRRCVCAPTCCDVIIGDVHFLLRNLGFYWLSFGRGWGRRGGLGACPSWGEGRRGVTLLLNISDHQRNGTVHVCVRVVSMLFAVLGLIISLTALVK